MPRPTTAYQTPTGCRRDAAATGANEEGTCPERDGDAEINSEGCQRCGGAGEVDDDYQGDPDEAEFNSEPHGESVGLRYRDGRNLEQLMHDHQLRMARLYDQIDKELTEAWRPS
jgi:hypothetical protein